MSGAKDYQKDFERLMGAVESKDDLLREQSAQSFMEKLEADRKNVGMQPKEMWRIFETKGLLELRAEIDRRLKGRARP